MHHLMTQAILEHQSIDYPRSPTRRTRDAGAWMAHSEYRKD